MAINGEWTMEVLKTGGQIFEEGERTHVENPVSGGVYYIHPERTVTFPDGTPLNQTIIEGGWRKIVVSENTETGEL